MSIRVDTASLIAGAVVVGHRGLGVLGASTDAAGFIRPAIALPADDAKEVRGLILATPAGLTSLTVDEDGGYSATGPDGLYTLDWQLFVDGADAGAQSYEFQLGVVPVGAEYSGTYSIASMSGGAVGADLFSVYAIGGGAPLPGSVRVDVASLIAGALVVGDRGLGVLGSEVPATGDDGPGYLYNDLDPGDETKEVRGLIETWPTDGVLLAEEDSSFTFDGAAEGAYSFTYRLFVDGVDLGTGTVDLTVGAVTAGADYTSAYAVLEAAGAQLAGAYAIAQVVGAAYTGTYSIAALNTVGASYTGSYFIYAIAPASLEEAMRNALLGYPPLSSLIGMRISPDKVEAGTPRPFVVYVVERHPIYVLDGTRATTEYTFTFQCWDDDRDTAETVADALEDALALATSIDPEGITVDERTSAFDPDLNMEAANVVCTAWDDA